MAGGFLEQSKLSEDLASQRNFFRAREIARRMLDFRFSILDWRTPGESYALVTRDQRSVNESFRRLLAGGRSVVLKMTIASSVIPSKARNSSFLTTVH